MTSSMTPYKYSASHYGERMRMATLTRSEVGDLKDQLVSSPPISFTHFQNKKKSRFSPKDSFEKFT